MRVTREQALAWRSDRHLLTEGADDVEDVVRRLGAVPALVGDPELAVRRRLRRSDPGAVAHALSDARLVMTYAFGGARLFHPADVGTYLALRSAGRQWERPSWRTFYRLEPEDWSALLAAVREALADGPLPRAALATAITAQPRFAHLGEAFEQHHATFLKALCWQGELCFGPTVDGVVTVRSPTELPGWRGLPRLEDAGPRAVLDYLDAYGPATPERLQSWLGEGLSAGRRRIVGWVEGLLGSGVTEVDVEGVPMLHRADALDALAHAGSPPEIVLLPGYDTWVLGPGTADELVVPAEHRAAATRGADLVLCRGRLAGTWRVRAGALELAWFPGATAPSPEAVTAEVARLAVLRGEELTTVVV